MTGWIPNAPLGVFRSPSRLCSEMPRMPSHAGHGPATCAQHSPLFSHARRAPVCPSSLRKLRVGYWGFDGKSQVGTLIVNRSTVDDLTVVFRRLYRARFPIRRMRPIDAYGGNDERSLAADNTAAFNCRYAVGPGLKRWSAHAYGVAIDVDPVENPYLEGGRVHPRAGRAYLDRRNVRPGMAVRGGLLV